MGYATIRDDKISLSNFLSMLLGLATVTLGGYSYPGEVRAAPVSAAAEQEQLDGLYAAYGATGSRSILRKR